MAEYRAPLTDIRFVLRHIADLPGIAALPGFEHAEPEVTEELLEQASRFMSEVMSPLSRVGDEQACRIENGQVRTPEGFAEAYRSYAEAGWGSLSLDPEFGGAGLPYTLSVAVLEMFSGANMAFSICPALGEGAIEALMNHGSDELKQTYLHRLVSGEWTSTMDLTEPHAGSDLGSLRCRAERQEDGSYRIKGTKIFISWGDHDFTENIVHLVLARTPDAPPGTRGISCFIVPKYLVNPDGTLGPRNDVKVVSIEHKLGIRASPTCVISYGESGEAVGYLIGEENRGLQYMFTMMNRERLFVATQGVAVAERAYQLAVDYARERRQGRAVGSTAPPGETDPIVEHADVRRMLMTMRSQIEAMRALLYATASRADAANRHPDAEERRAADERVALLTPVAKAWLTDLGVEIASLAIQVHGGVGYVEETGVAQHFRDARIAPIYEGTNGIQALDLVMRKLGLSGGDAVRSYLDELQGIEGDLEKAGDEVAELGAPLARGIEALRSATDWLLARRESDPRGVAAGASPYLRLFGTVAGAYYLARSALAASTADDVDAGFARDKRACARFYAQQILPQAQALLPAVTGGDALLFELDPDRL